MFAPTLFAFLHHVSAFTLVAALAVEAGLLQTPLSLVQARRLQRADLIYGIAAGSLLTVGLLRVAYFEKGPSYYWHDVFFIIKLSAFALVGLVSIYPTRLFLSWNRSLRGGATPQVAPAQVRRLRMCVNLELAAIVVILLCAVLMARGFGYRP